MERRGTELKEKMKTERERDTKGKKWTEGQQMDRNG